MEEQLNCVIESGKLLGVKLFQVNDNFFELSEDNLWIIDAGIELTFPDGKITVGWNIEEEMFCFKCASFSDLYSSSNYFELYNDNICYLNKIINTDVIETSYKYITYEYVFDYKMNTKKETSLAELLLVFNSGDKLQIATIGYDLKPWETPQNFRYDVSQGLLICFNNYEKIIELPTD